MMKPPYRRRKAMGTDRPVILSFGFDVRISRYARGDVKPLVSDLSRQFSEDSISRRHRDLGRSVLRYALGADMESTYDGDCV